jgi:CelD/BcsL family acetyltransferase involved in cellulose biosynthesis
MTVHWVEDPEAFASRDWARLVEADPEATFFHTSRWLKLYWEEFGNGPPLIGHVAEGGGPLAAAAFELAGDRLTWLGGFDVTDYMGPAGLPDARTGAAKEILASLCARADWRDADLAGLPEDGGWVDALTEAAGAVGLTAEVSVDGVAPRLRLPHSFEAYLAGLPPKRRHEIRRKARRLVDRYPDAHLVDVTPETLPQAMDRFVELHRSSPGEKGKFLLPRMELFFRRFSEELLRDGTMRMSFLETAGKGIAGAVGFRWRDGFLLYNSAFDRAYAAVAPGMVLVAEMIRTAIDEGCRLFDMLKGDLSYKYRFGARPRRVMRLRLTREHGPT